MLGNFQQFAAEITMRFVNMVALLTSQFIEVRLVQKKKALSFFDPGFPGSLNGPTIMAQMKMAMQLLLLEKKVAAQRQGDQDPPNGDCAPSRTGNVLPRPSKMQKSPTWTISKGEFRIS